MKKVSIVFLQAVVVLIGILALGFLVFMPLKEGRAKNLDLISVYADPFILFAYATSLAFFFALFKAFQLLGLIGQNRVFSIESVNALKAIKYCIIVLGASIALTGIYVKIFNHKDDDPAGFLAMCIFAIFSCLVVGTAAAIFEKILSNAVNMKSENDLTI